MNFYIDYLIFVCYSLNIQPRKLLSVRYSFSISVFLSSTEVIFSLALSKTAFKNDIKTLLFSSEPKIFLKAKSTFGLNSEYICYHSFLFLILLPVISLLYTFFLLLQFFSKKIPPPSTKT